jgi:hypothetical protein
MQVAFWNIQQHENKASKHRRAVDWEEILLVAYLKVSAETPPIPLFPSYFTVTEM